ncbi:phage baseplate assembly protein V [Citrobacter sp. Awk 4]|uniref:phage baseplate assembly protein V n=1 Tax=Citrobacter sp. Awk 4 TaxID=2963955 RepID=UPI002303A8EC|nr:phage baseplate assembly protein V [Citrobacter sp. Awk 4]MDA8481215.1 phage baseplate assembly protein V [Citrobacter sp. Awk 4]
MRPVPSIILLAGETRQPLVAFKPERLDTQHKVNAIPGASVVLSRVQGGQGDAVYEEELTLCGAGQRMDVLLLDKEERQLIFRGVVVEQRLQIRREYVEMVLTLRHDLQRLQGTHRSQVFEQQTDAMVAGNMFLGEAIPVAGIAGMDILHDQLVQCRCSDWQFLRSRLNANGVWLYPAPEGVSIFSPVLSPVPVHTLRRRTSDIQGDVLIEDSHWCFSEQYQPATLTVSSWDAQIQNNDIFPAHPVPMGNQAFNSTSGHCLNLTSWAFNYSTPLGMEQTAQLANSLLMNLQAARATGEFRLDGGGHYRLGDTLALEGYGTTMDGYGIVTGIRQSISKESGWRSTLSLGVNEVLRDMNIIPRISGLHIGVVSAFMSDPSGMNRLRVKIPMLGESNQELWARLATPYASALSGFCFYPNEGDEVVIGFFDENPCYPVIIGSMHNPLNPAPVMPSQENTVKTLVVNHAGQKCELMFNTVDNSVALRSPEGELNLGQGGLLESSSLLTLKARDVSLEGEKTALSGKNRVSVTGAKISLSN